MGNIELTPRKQAVLKAIIKAYIEKGEPIGSKNLTVMLENAPSSATIRNEMSELCELGLLTQPHISAGRIPTNDGYRMYVNSLMSKKELSQKTKEYIESAFKKGDKEPENIPQLAAEMLTSVTGYPAIACVLTEKSSRFKRIELVDMGKSALMLLVLTDDGRSRSRIFRKSGGYSVKEQNIFLTVSENRLKGIPISRITKGYIQNVIANMGEFSLELLPLFTAVYEMACEFEAAAVTLNGENALYNICADEQEARKILNLIKNKDPMLSIFQRLGENVSAVFGADTGYTELNKRTLITAKFKGGDKYKGYIGIIGPNRMQYDQVMPVIEYTAMCLSGAMTQAQQDMED